MFNNLIKKTFIDKIRVNLRYINHLKIKPKHLFISQLNKYRANHMISELSNQIKNYKKFEKGKFIFVEIGSYLGESLELFGEHIHKELKNNYLIISIDPYVPYNSSLEKTETSLKFHRHISKVYYYFMNNISKTNFKHNHFHLKMKSTDAFELLKIFNIKIDLCYIDGCHYYQNIKEDFTNYNSILKKNINYNGKICGDDYEITFKEAVNIFDYSENELRSILEENKNLDYLDLNNQKGFHPGITLFFNEIEEKIKKYESGFWIKEDDSLN